MADLSLDLLEIGCNSLDAGAKLLNVEIYLDRFRAMMSVEDDGEGMSVPTMLRACEKGFSTKGSTGLGLYKVSSGAKSVSICPLDAGGVRVDVEYIPNGVQIGLVGDSVATLLSGADMTIKLDIHGFEYELDTRHIEKQNGRLPLGKICEIKGQLNCISNKKN